MESSASALGLAQRIPEREVVALDADGAVPKALEGQTLEGLIVGIATRPSSYRDLPGLGQWLR